MKIYHSGSIGFHINNAVKYLGWEHYNPETDKDLPTIFTLYFECDYEALREHRGKAFVFWHGTDVLFINSKERLYLLRERVPVQACQNQLQQEFLATLGIYAHVRHTFFCDFKRYTKFNGEFTKDAYISSHPGRETEYGEDMINAVAVALPEWNFHIFGTDRSLPMADNVKHYGQIPEEEMDEITKGFAATIRWKTTNGEHFDGCPQTVIKALMRGQIALTGIPYPFTYHVKGIGDIINMLKDYKLHLRTILPKVEVNNFDWLEGL